VDLRKKGADSLTASAIVYFRRTQPTLSNIYLGHEMKQFMKKLSNPDASPDSVERLKWKEAYSSEELDSKTALPKKLNLASDQNSLVFYLKEQVQKGDLLEYQVNRNGEVFSNWRKNEFDNGFVWLTNLPPGNYELRMRFTIQPENVTTFPFRIRPRWDQTFTFRLIAGGLLAAFFGFLLLLVRLQWQRQKLRRTQAQRDKAETDLRAIYSQLNPHFIFNALSSIQALVNRNDAEHANHYLSSFSKLLRASLVNSERALVPLSRELEMLENYLQLEQLRFPFEYTLEAEEDIVASSVVVPSLLLQPLVENAIKHGVSGMQKRGVIRISFSRTNNDIVINITDNGTGFDTNSATNGYGLKLTKERIRLLNEGGGEQQVLMFISSEAMKGTSILVQFKNWL
jgi:two-component sensor histidine kinase